MGNSKSLVGAGQIGFLTECSHLQVVTRQRLKLSGQGFNAHYSSGNPRIALVRLGWRVAMRVSGGRSFGSQGKPKLVIRSNKN